jgi:2-hydroxy-3-keto-5-methylthiopentenyl-1-phosphate phosphatase
MNSMKQPIIFCDFDGTITLSDNIITIVRHYDVTGWRKIVEDTMNQRISIRQGVGDLFSLFPVSMKNDIVDYVLTTAEIRAGFLQLLQHCKKSRIPFKITSGGIDFFLKPMLQGYPVEDRDIYCNSADFSEENIKIVWQHTCDKSCDNDCGLCKASIIRSFPREQYHAILIGDSLTDFAAAHLADTIFARSHLATRCKELGMPYYHFETFFDVLEVLKHQYNQEDK